MNSNKTLGIIFAIVIGVIFVGSLLAPTIDNYDTEKLTIQNTGSYFTTVDAEDEHTIVFSTDKIVYDGVDVAYPEGFGTGNDRNATLMVGEDWFLRADAGITRLLVAGPPQQYLVLGNLSDGDITATISGGDVTFAYGTDSTATREGVVMTVANEGDYVLCNNPYILEDTNLIGGIRNIGVAYDTFEVVKGTINNMTAEASRVYVWATSTNTTIDNAVFTPDVENVSGNLLKLNKIEENLTFADGGEVTINISYLIAPVEITYDNPEYIGDEYSGILGAIIIISIVALLMLGVKMITRRD